MNKAIQTGKPDPLDRGTVNRINGGSDQSVPSHPNRFQQHTGLRNIWAYNTQVWTDNGNSWHQSIHFTTIRELVDELNRNNLRRRIGKLGIVAHGDAPGSVQISTATNLNHQNVGPYMHETLVGWLNNLGTYLTRSATVIFFSCIAGQGSNGDQLLTSLSRIWPGVTVIGFTTYSMVNTSFNADNTPGNLYDTRQFVYLNAQLAMQESIAGRRHLERVSIQSDTAKWAYRGNITRIPAHDNILRRTTPDRTIPRRTTPRRR